jgi:isopropylmalate/homocitrate/citramalate synthase
MIYPTKIQNTSQCYVKNRRHAIKILIELRGYRLDDYAIEHWENTIRLIASKAKQNEVAKNRAM